MDIKLSACTITKNEENNIEKSINSYKDIVDEIIIVDTGSTDKTVEIAEKLGAKVYHFDWINDFAAAKNFALEKAKGDWIIFLDADEWFENGSAKNITAAIERTIAKDSLAIACKLTNFVDEKNVLESSCTARVFKSDSNIRYFRAIHETLFLMKENEPVPGLFTDVFSIGHSGYMRNIQEKKRQRNSELLSKNYASGNYSPIDLYYCLRENYQLNYDISKYFFRVIDSDPNFINKVESFNVHSSIFEEKVKFILESKDFSFEKRKSILEEAKNAEPENPIFKYYEYVLYNPIDRERAIEALYESIKLNKDFEVKNPSETNSFYVKHGQVYAALGMHEMLKNDKIKALEYFTEAIKMEYFNSDALKGLLSVISSENDTDKITFINSIYDINKEEVLKFLVENLRLTEYKEVFLYYFVTWNKKFGEINCAFFTSRLITGNYEEIVDTYVKVYKETKDIKALNFISAALIAGDCKDKFFEVVPFLDGNYIIILNSFFNSESLEEVNDRDFATFNSVFSEIAYIASDDILLRFLRVFKKVAERAFFEVNYHYFGNYSYDKVKKWLSFLDSENVNSKGILAYKNSLLAHIYFRTGEPDKISECIDNAVSMGILDVNFVFLCKYLEADDEKIAYFMELFEDLNTVVSIGEQKIANDISTDSMKFMTIEKLKDEISDKKIDLLEEHLLSFFNFACKAFTNKAYAYAEKYFKICIKHDYETDRAYYFLGKIYNIFKKPDLSFYCYEKAFYSGFQFSKKILPRNHKNVAYIASKKEETGNNVCPVCAKVSEPFASYPLIFDENLSYNDPIIVEYMRCGECGHVFAKNDIKDKCFWTDEKEKVPDDSTLEMYYDIVETLTEVTDGNKILDLSEDSDFEVCAENYGFEVFDGSKDVAGKFEVIYGSSKLDAVTDVCNFIESVSNKLSDEGIFVFDVYDISNAFSILSDEPYWVKAGVRNVFSRASLDKLLRTFELNILQIDVSKTQKGKIIIYAGK